MWGLQGEADQIHMGVQRGVGLTAIEVNPGHLDTAVHFSNCRIK